MLETNKSSNKLSERIISNLNWDFIIEVNKFFKMGVGEGVSAIPGLKRKSYDSALSKNDLKNELRKVIKYVISNNLMEFSYGPWLIYWKNADWINQDLEFIDDEDDGDEDDYKDVNIVIDSTLEVLYAPQRTFIVDITPRGAKEAQTELDNIFNKAVEIEDYELAGKLREVINFQKNRDVNE